MRSPTERGARARRALELSCRAGALALLACALFSELRGTSSAPPSPDAMRGDALMSTQLAALTMSASDAPLHVTFDAAPDAVTRGWLRALARSGRDVRWSGTLAPMAIAVEPVAEPGGGVRIIAAAPDGRVARIGDDAGIIDSVRTRGGGVELRVPTIEGRARLSGERGAVATSAAVDSVLVRDVLIFGRPSWETRFVTAALEEAGWRVRLRTPLAPGQAVEQGSAALDTARVGAVVVLDSTARAFGEPIARFVRAGGGLVAAATAVRELPAIAALAAGGSTTPQGVPIADVGDSVTRRLLPLAPIAMRGDAVALERRDAVVSVAARRVGAGRVVQVGYGDTWRWRMSGGDSGAVAHRRWWSALVASVAYAPVVHRMDTAGLADPAPLAATIAALGPPRASDVSAPVASRLPRPGLLALALVFALLLTEWISRRLRGAR